MAGRDRLLPTIPDYDDLEPPQPNEMFAEWVAVDAKALRAEAAAQPGRVVEGRIANRVQVRVCVEPGDPAFLVVAVSEHLRPGDIVLPKQWQLTLAAAFFPGVEFQELPLFPLEFDDTDVRDDELAMRHFMTSD